MAVAAQYVDNRWYRAEVSEVLRNNRYRVKYVDFGESQTLQSCRIRAIPEASTLAPPRVRSLKVEKKHNEMRVWYFSI